MNTVMKRVFEKHVPKFNKSVVDGLTKNELRKMTETIDDIFRSECRSFNPELDIRYKGYRHVSPEEEFIANFRTSSTRRPYDLSQSDTYPVCFIFEFEGQNIEKTLLLPYAKKGNLMSIYDVERVVVPVVSDSIITISSRDVFCRLHKDKNSFTSDIHHAVYNGDVVATKNIYVVFLKDKVKNDGYGKVSVPNAGLYILSKYGFAEACKRYIGKELAEQDLKLKDDDILVIKGPTDAYTKDYNIYGSRNVKPNDMLLAEEYIPHEISICLKKRIKETPFIKNFFFGIIHSFDVAFDIAPIVYDLLKEGDVEEEIRHWRKILGVITYKGERSVFKVEEDTRDIIQALSFYLNKGIISRLATIDLFVENMFDLIYEIMKNFDQWSLQAKMYNMDFNKKHVDVLYYMSYPYIQGINRTIYEINKRFKKATQTNKMITYKEACSAMRKNLPPEMIFNIVRSKTKHFNMKDPEVNNASVYLGATSMLEDQSCAQGVVVAKDRRIPPHCKFLNAPSVYIGSVYFLSKSKPGIPFKVNPFSEIDPKTGKFTFSPDIQKDIDFISKRLSNVSEDTDQFEEFRSDITVEKSDA